MGISSMNHHLIRADDKLAEIDGELSGSDDDDALDGDAEAELMEKSNGSDDDNDNDATAKPAISERHPLYVLPLYSNLASAQQAKVSLRRV